MYMRLCCSVCCSAYVYVYICICAFRVVHWQVSVLQCIAVYCSASQLCMRV